MPNATLHPNEKRRHFNHQAYAVALAGHITLPFEHVIEAQASCALPQSGGYSSDRINDYRLKEIVSCKAAYTSATGSYSEKDDCFYTVASATVEDLDILGIVKIGKFCGRVMSRHPYVDPAANPSEPVEPSIVPLGSCFENVTIAGHPVKVVLNVGKACQFSKYTDFRNNAGDHLKVYKANGTDKTGPIHCSLVDRLEFENAPELELKAPNSIYLDHFGTITLAELIVNPRGRRIRMLHVELGCGTEGSADGGSGEVTGSPPGH
ncbi:MAG: hypothetical protein ACR2NN_18725 [Bryobacteraceae bacterium]